MRTQAVPSATSLPSEEGLSTGAKSGISVGVIAIVDFLALGLILLRLKSETRRSARRLARDQRWEQGHAVQGRDNPIPPQVPGYGKGYSTIPATTQSSDNISDHSSACLAWDMHYVHIRVASRRISLIMYSNLYMIR